LALENPHKTKVFGEQHRYSVNFWAGVLGDNLIGPYILPKN
jgi:hypothetical protein